MIPDFIRNLWSKPEQPKDTWAAGDIAECIYAGGWHRFVGPILVLSNGPEKGDQMKVTDVTAGEHHLVEGHFVWLTFRQWPQQLFSAAAFRKVIPTHDVAKTDETISIDDLIGKPVKVDA